MHYEHEFLLGVYGMKNKIYQVRIVVSALTWSLTFGCVLLKHTIPPVTLSHLRKVSLTCQASPDRPLTEHGWGFQNSLSLILVLDYYPYLTLPLRSRCCSRHVNSLQNQPLLATRTAIYRLKPRYRHIDQTTEDGTS